MVAFVLALPYVPYQAWAFIAPGLTLTKKAFGNSADFFEHLAISVGHGLRLFFSSSVRSSHSSPDLPPRASRRPRYRGLSFVCSDHVCCLYVSLRFLSLVVLVRLGVVSVEKLKEMAFLLHRGSFVVAADAAGCGVSTWPWQFPCACSTNLEFRFPNGNAARRSALKSPRRRSISRFPETRDALNATNILIVCMGNICRSPMAEEVVRVAFARAGLGGSIQVDSAGTPGSHAGENLTTGRSRPRQPGLHLRGCGRGE